MESYPTTVATSLAQTHSAEPTSVTAATCLEFIQQNAGTLRDANFTMLAAGVLYIHCEVVWVAKSSARKPKDAVRLALMKAFSEADIPNSNVSRSKQYEFARLCITLARHKEMRPLAVRAAENKSVVLAARHLADEFAQVAASVAALARYFGTERSSGGHSEPVKRPFLVVLRALVEQAQRNEDTIPFVDAVKVLTPAAAQRDLLELLRQLIPHTTNEALPELIDIANRVIESRRTRA